MQCQKCLHSTTEPLFIGNTLWIATNHVYLQDSWLNLEIQQSQNKTALIILAPAEAKPRNLTSLTKCSNTLVNWS